MRFSICSGQQCCGCGFQIFRCFVELKGYGGAKVIFFFRT